MFGHILVPLDGSQRDDQVLPVVARIARASGAQITLMTIVSLPSEYFMYPMWTGPVPADCIERDEREAEAHLNRLKESRILHGLVVHTVVFPGFLVERLTRTIGEQNIDLVVMCSHGAVGLKRMLMGSVAQQLVRTCTVPVLIIKEQNEGQSIVGRNKPFQFMVALDGSPMAESALKPAAILSALLSDPLPGKLHLLRVVRPIYSVSRDGHETTAQANLQAIQKADAYLKDVVRRILLQIVPGTLLDISTSIRTDEDVSETLMEVAHEDELHMTCPAEGIALATHGRHGIPRWLLGSVTEHVLNHSSYPLLIVHQPENNEKFATSGEASMKTHLESEEPEYHPFAMFYQDTSRLCSINGI
jgi:nucleotide-binding universal stress UspA family protein